MLKKIVIITQKPNGAGEANRPEDNNMKLRAL